MIGRVATALVLIVVVVVITTILNRRKGDGPTVTGNELPSHVDRNDFVSPNTSFLVVVFSAASCLACGDVWSWVQTLESSTVAVQDIEAKRDRALHQRYRIDSVPATLVIDDVGVVVSSVLGPLSPTDKTTIADLVANAPMH